MNEAEFSHLVEIDKVNKQLIIYRVFSDGKKQLYTQVDLPPKGTSKNKSNFEQFALTLGENLLIDSPIARKILGI